MPGLWTGCNVLLIAHRTVAGAVGETSGDHFAPDAVALWPVLATAAQTTPDLRRFMWSDALFGPNARERIDAPALTAAYVGAKVSGAAGAGVRTPLPVAERPLLTIANVIAERRLRASTFPARERPRA
jgi:hypothetical protein